MKSELPAGVAAICAALLLLCGCRQADVSAADRADRASRLYSSAMAELQAGRIDSAIEGFQAVVRAEPANGNAHFQLAALLEDVKKDYLGAIVHYRLYSIIRPDSEKVAVAIDRMKGCEARYAADAVAKAGLESNLYAETAKLREEHGQCAKKIAALSADLEAANRKIASMEKSSELKSKMLEKANGIADDANVDRTPRKNLRPTDAQLLDEDDGGLKVSSNEIKNLKAMLDEDERTANPPPAEKPAAKDKGGAAANNPFAAIGGAGDGKKKQKREIPETYTVEEGDTLMRISTKFYGTNRKWREIREANKTVISPDGRVRAGQVIKLP